MVTKAKKALLASLAAFLCVMLTVFGLSMSVSLSEKAKAADETTTEVAEVNGVKFATLAEAVNAVSDGGEIVVYSGVYTIPNVTYTGKSFTISAGVDQTVSFDMSVAHAIHGAKVSFNNVTFDYKTNNNYIGLQHADTLTYKGCTINGMVFLYAINETFNGCTFNQTSKDAYNVWTYGAKNVVFNHCVFNSAGKSVLVYNEGANPKTDLTVSETKFVASEKVDGKAAIEIDTSLMAGGTTITIDDKTTATDFAAGSNSGNTLWNDKKQTADTNKNTTITVADEVVYAPYVVAIGEVKYFSLTAAIAAAKDGETVKLLADVEQNSQLSINKNITLDLNGKKIYNTKDIWGDNAVAVIAIKDGAEVTVMGDGTIAAKKDDCYTFNIIDGELTIENGTFIGNISVVQVQEGRLTINGGTFSLLQKWDGEDRYLINCIDDAFTANKAQVAIYGGSFAGFDPNVSPEKKVDGKVPSFAAPGVGITKNKDGSFTAKANMAAQILDSDGNSVAAYATLAEAIAAAKGGETVKLLADATADVVVDKNITLDLGGNTLTGTNSGKATLTIAKGATATVKNGSVIGTSSFYNIQNNGTATFESLTATAGNTGSSMIDNWGTLTITSGTYTGGMDTVKSEEGSKLTINGGKFKNSFGKKWSYTATILVYGDTLITGGEFIQETSNTSSYAKVVMTGVVDGYTSITKVTGGSFTSTRGIFWALGKATSDNFEVSGGTFNKSISEGFCADGFIPTKQADGTYGVKEGKYVAKVGSTKYETLADAIRLAANGKTVTLLDNITLTEQLVIGKNLTIDLGGFTLTSNYSLVGSGANIYAIVLNAAVTIKNGKIVANNARVIGAYGAMIMDGVTVENGIIGGHATIGLSKAGSEYVIRNSTIKGAYSVSIFANNATVTIENSNITGRGPALYHNGSNYGLRLTVTDTTLTSETCGVYISGYASMKDQADNRNNADGYQQATFTRCTISGTNGIEVKYTNLTLNSCNISATVKTPTYEQNNNGSTASGFAVVSTDNATGGTTPAPKGTIAVSGEGNYVGAIGIGTLVKNTYEGFEDASYAVSGGKFNHAILPEYCAEGFIPQDNGDGTYGVKVGTYVAEVKGVKYETLQAAIDAAKAGNTVTLLANTKENVTIAKELTLDLNGYTINGGTEKGKPAVTVKARVTIKDSSADQTGTIMREDTAGNSGVSSHYVIDVQDGWLTFEGGKVINNSGNVAGKGASLVRVGNDSVAKFPGLNIKGGTFTQNNFIVIKIDSGDLFLNGGTLTSANSYAIENWHRATVKGGTVNGAVSSWTYSGGFDSTLTISGGTINGKVESVTYDGAAGKLAKVSITGGTVTGTLSNKVYSGSSEVTTAMATIEVTGGTFSIDPSKYVVEESAITENADGTYGVEKAYLVRVGNTSYYTMDEAFKAQTASGEAIVMLRDYTTGSTFNSGSIHRVVDLNGHTWTCTSTDMNSAAFEINYSNATLTVKNGKIISNTLVGLIPSAMGGTIMYDNAGLVFEKVEMTSNGGSGIETNGNNTNDSVTLKNSTLNVPNGFGIYFPSSGTLTIDNSTINAKTMGVQVCSGELNINAGSAITVTGDAVPKAENDGAIQDGAAISIVNRPGYKGLSNIVITGGTFTAKAGNDAIKAYDWNNAEKTESTFTKADLVAVSGGTFSSEVKKDYLAKGYRLTKTGESYGVTAKYIESTHVSLGTALSFSYKLRTLNNGETIKNAKASYRTVRGNLVEIDMTLVDGYYVFDGITPQMLDRKISVNVYIGDTVVYDVVDYSIIDYLQDLLNTKLGKATVTKQLVADLAFYGKAAMKYVGYTTTVVDKFIADNGLTQSTGDITGVATSSGTEKVANVSVQFASQNKILIGVAESVFKDYSYTIKVNGTKIDRALWQTDVVDGYRVYVSDGFAASYITDENHYVEVEVLKNETSVQKVQCNVAGYCMKMVENARMGELAKATYYYGVSAAKYANFEG